MILQAAGGHYQRVAVVEGKGINLGTEATVDDIAGHFSAIADLTGARHKESAVS
jgi:hypothetical protein